MKGKKIVSIILGLALSCWVSISFSEFLIDDKQANPPVIINMTEDGPVFATRDGMTLYTFDADRNTPGQSQCTNTVLEGIPDPTAGYGLFPYPRVHERRSCVEQSPPLMADSDAISAGDWSLIERPEGGYQWAYQDRPLYTSIKDRKPGDVNGALSIGQLRGWSVAQAPLNFPPGLSIMQNGDQLVIATANGRPVYTPGNVRSHSVCTGCERFLDPISAPAIARVTGDWSVVDVGAGGLQYAFRGQPLFSAPNSHTNNEIEATGEWQTVVFKDSTGTPESISTQLTLLGEVYADEFGRTLYVFTCGARDGTACDEPGDAAAFWSALCGSECAERWRPVIASEEARDIGHWSVVDVAYPMFTEATGRTYPAEAPRVQAWAYRGRPVYTFHMDKQPGDLWGHANRWFSFSGFYALEVPGKGLHD